MKRPAESSAAVRAPALRQELLLFDELVHRPDSLLNPMASERQLMVDDVLTLVRRYTQTRLLSTFDWQQGKIVTYEIDTDTVRQPVNLCGFAGSLFLPQCVAWANGWVARTGPRKVQHFPLCNTGPRDLPLDCRHDESVFTTICETTGAGALVAFHEGRNSSATFEALHDAAPETKPASRVTFSDLAVGHFEPSKNVSSIGENHVFCDTVVSFPFVWNQHAVEILDLVSMQVSRFAPDQVPWQESAKILQTPRSLVLEAWFDHKHSPLFVVDCRQERIITLTTPEDDELVDPMDQIRCTPVDDYTVACVASRWTDNLNDAGHWAQFMLYDRRAARHSVVRPARSADTGFENPVFHVSEPLNASN